MTQYMKYLKWSIWDFVLCIIMAASLGFVEGSGFYVSEQFHGNYGLLLGVVMATTLILFAVSYNKKSIGIAIAVFVILAAGLVVLMVSNPSMRGVLADEAGNPWLYVTLLILTSIFVYLLSRTKWGNCGLLILGILILSMIQFLYKTYHFIPFLLFLCTCGVMYIFKNYQKSVMESQTVKLAFGRTFVIAWILVAVILLLGTGVFYGIVNPMDPQARELKLITKYMSLDTLQEIGVASEYILTDPDRFTQNTDDTEQTARQAGEEKNKNPNSSDKGQKEQQEQEKGKKNEADRLDKNDRTKVFYAIKHNLETLSPWWWILLAVLLIAAAILLKHWLRIRWFKKVQEQPKNSQIKQLYNFYLKKFALLGVEKQPGDTPKEFAERADRMLQAFHVGKTNIKTLTETFIEAAYDPAGVTEKGYKEYLNFHKCFYSCCRKHLGNFKYIIKFFRV